MHEGRVQRVYERRWLVTKPPFPFLNVGIKTQFPAQSGTVYAGPFFLSRPSFLSAVLILRFFHFTTAVSPERCLLNEAFPRELSFFLLGRNALHAACKRLRCSVASFALFPVPLLFPLTRLVFFTTVVTNLSNTFRRRTNSLSRTSVSAVVYESRLVPR